MKRMLCIIGILLGIGFCSELHPAAAQAVSATTISAEAEEPSRSAGEILAVLGIFTVTAAVTAGVIIRSSWKKGKAQRRKQAEDAEEKQG